jgi:hypothetical protein
VCGVAGDGAASDVCGFAGEPELDGGLVGDGYALVDFGWTFEQLPDELG